MQELKRFDLAEIRKAIGVLFRDVRIGSGECVEIRMPDKRKMLTVSGWFDDFEKMAKAVALAARDGFTEGYRTIHDNLYWTLNPVNDALLARQPKNKLAIAPEASSDNNITRRLWLPVDIDPLRPSGVSATKEERKLALDVANSLNDKLTEMGFPESCLVGGTSGNGYHLLIRVDLPNDDESKDLVKKCLAAMQELVGTSKVEIDPKVFNSARIFKCYGTMACKGVNTPDRPWRMSGMTIIPESVTTADRELLERLAALAPEKNPRRQLGEKKQGPWDEDSMQEFVEWTGWECREVSDVKAIRKWVGPCINDENHKDAALMLFKDGWWSWTCFHASCKGVGHKEFQEHWEMENGEKYPTPGRHRAESVLGPSEFQAIWDMVGGKEKNEIREFNLTDAGNMERFVFRYGHGFRYCPERDWYRWDGQRWKFDDIATIRMAALDTVRHIKDEVALVEIPDGDPTKDPAVAKALAKIAEINKWAKSSESRNHLAAMVDLAQAAPEMAIPIRDFDTDNWVFNCANGTIDLRSGDFRPANPSDLITKMSPIAFDATATCPLWESFLSDIMAENAENIAFLQRAMGYTLSGSISEHCMFLLWGAGRNGKSTFLEVLRHLMGDYGKAASMNMFLEKYTDTIPNDLAALQGSRYVSATESKEGRSLDESLIKQITGGDTVTARFLHREFFEFVPEFKIWLATNHRPVIRGADEGIWRRIRLVPFTVYIPDGKKDEKLKDKLLAEAPGILNWALRGLEAFRRDGLMEPQAIISATATYRAEEDWMARFFQEETQADPNGMIQAKDFYNRYKRWAEEVREKVVNERRFNEHLTAQGVKSRMKDGRKFYQGFRLRDLVGNILSRHEDMSGVGDVL